MKAMFNNQNLNKNKFKKEEGRKKCVKISNLRIVKVK